LEQPRRKLGFVVLKEVRQQYLSRTYPVTLLDIIAGANQRGRELLVAE
jgi:hypothetical protein